MSLGDITSNQRGSGARYNDGKPDFSLIPLEHVARGYLAEFSTTSNETDLAYALLHLGKFQVSGRVTHLDDALRLMGFAWADCAKVLMKGAKKYAPWNWAKGMPWSSVIACAGRHAWKVLELGEYTDDETGESHYGHFLANLVFLRTFVDTYPEGKDLAPPEFFAKPDGLRICATEIREKALERLTRLASTRAPVALYGATDDPTFAEMCAKAGPGEVIGPVFDNDGKPNWPEIGHLEQPTCIRASVPRTTPVDDHCV